MYRPGRPRQCHREPKTTCGAGSSQHCPCRRSPTGQPTIITGTAFDGGHRPSNMPPIRFGTGPNTRSNRRCKKPSKNRESRAVPYLFDVDYPAVVRPSFVGLVVEWPGASRGKELFEALGGRLLPICVAVSVVSVALAWASHRQRAAMHGTACAPRNAAASVRRHRSPQADLSDGLLLD